MRPSARGRSATAWRCSSRTRRSRRSPRSSRLPAWTGATPASSRCSRRCTPGVWHRQVPDPVALPPPHCPGRPRVTGDRHLRRRSPISVRDVREHAEARPLERELVELGVPAAELVEAMLVTGRDLRVAHGQRASPRLHRAEPVATTLELTEHVHVDLDVEHLVEAPHEGVAPRLVGVNEGAPAGNAGARIDDPVAVHLAAAARELVLRAEGYVRGRLLDRNELVHDRIVSRPGRLAQDLTPVGETGSPAAPAAQWTAMRSL